MTSPFVQVGGVRVGASYWDAWNASLPFARITVSEDAIDISVSLFFSSSRRYTFAAATVRCLSVYSGLFSRGLRIEHTVADCPPFVIFWTFGLRALAVALEQRGFHIERPGVTHPPSSRVA